MYAWVVWWSMWMELLGYLKVKGDLSKYMPVDLI